MAIVGLAAYRVYAARRNSSGWRTKIHPLMRCKSHMVSSSMSFWLYHSPIENYFIDLFVLLICLPTLSPSNRVFIGPNGRVLIIEKKQQIYHENSVIVQGLYNNKNFATDLWYDYCHYIFWLRHQVLNDGEIFFAICRSGNLHIPCIVMYSVPC